MNTFVLKLIAIITMTIDHFAIAVGTNITDGQAELSPYMTKPVYMILRGIGRIAFPIFAYLIVEGFFYTKNLTKYILRLFIFAFISQVPFSLVNSRVILDTHKQNVFFTLGLGLICVYMLDMLIKLSKQAKEKNEPMPYINIMLGIGIIIICIVSVVLNTDYSIMGILLIMIFYIFRADTTLPKMSKPNILRFTFLGISMMLLILTLNFGIEIFAPFALIPIAMHNRQKGPSMKYFFYAYYPGHFAVLYLIICILPF